MEKRDLTLSQHDIEKLIITVRGEQVMIDRDIAFVYQVEVKQMNRQVKRNIERFPEDFMFQLTKEEYNSLRCHFGTSNRRGGDRRTKHNAQYPEIEFIQIPHKNHDRFLTVDNEVYLLGASVKDMGIGLCAITKMTISPEKLLSYMN